MATVIITGYTRSGDAVVATGTVDGRAAQTQMWASAMIGMSAAQKQTFVAKALAAASPPPPVIQTDLNGTVTV